MPVSVQEKQLHAAMHRLHPSVPVPAQWAAMSKNVSLHGSSYVKLLLSKRQLPVPDIEGAVGAKLVGQTPQT